MIATQSSSVGVTTVFLFTDVAMTTALLKQATQQEFRPEWVITAYQYQDLSILSRNYDLDQWSQRVGISNLYPYVASVAVRTATTTRSAWFWGPNNGTYSVQTARPGKRPAACAVRGGTMHSQLTELPLHSPASTFLSTEWGGMAVGFTTVPMAVDCAPLYADMPGGVCNCPHWGYIFEGALTAHYPNGEHEDDTAARRRRVLLPAGPRAPVPRADEGTRVQSAGRARGPDGSRVRQDARAGIRNRRRVTERHGSIIATGYERSIMPKASSPSQR